MAWRRAIQTRVIRRFPAQEHRQGRFLRVAFGPCGQFRLGPAGAVHPVFDELFGPVFIGFLALAGRLVPPAGPAKPLGEPLGEIRHSQPPVAT